MWTNRNPTLILHAYTLRWKIDSPGPCCVKLPQISLRSLYEYPLEPLMLSEPMSLSYRSSGMSLSVSGSWMTFPPKQSRQSLSVELWLYCECWGTCPLCLLGWCSDQNQFPAASLSCTSLFQLRICQVQTGPHYANTVMAKVVELLVFFALKS